MQQFSAKGQKLGATGQLNTIWDDDGETIANSNWYGILFGAEAAWHQGEASIPNFQSSYGANFHGDLTGKIDQAQKELMAAHQLLSDSSLKSDGDDVLFWVDPWSAQGERQAAQIRPILSGLRLHAERAIVLVDEAMRANPNLREVEALEALQLGARRMDFIGFKFQVADEMAASYATALALQSSKKAEDRETVLTSLDEIQGKMRDLSEAYSLLRDLYREAWLKCQRPYFLNNNLERYSQAVQLWQQRGVQVNALIPQWESSQAIPPAATLGIPAPAAR
jgi:hypothetical protein